jgi:hypothetical protein
VPAAENVAALAVLGENLKDTLEQLERWRIGIDFLLNVAAYRYAAAEAIMAGHRRDFALVVLIDGESVADVDVRESPIGDSIVVMLSRGDCRDEIELGLWREGQPEPSFLYERCLTCPKPLLTLACAATQLQVPNPTRRLSLQPVCFPTLKSLQRCARVALPRSIDA